MSLSKSFGALVAVVLACVAVPSIAIASPPETVLLSGPEALVASSTVTFAFAAEGDHADTATFQCRLDSTGEWEACESPVTYTGLADGAHHFEVRAADEGHHGWPWWHHGGHWGDGGHWGEGWHWGGEEWECFGTPVEVDFTVDTTPPNGDDRRRSGRHDRQRRSDDRIRRRRTRRIRMPARRSADRLDAVLLADDPHRTHGRRPPLRSPRPRRRRQRLPGRRRVSFAVDTTLPETLVETAPAPRIDVGEASFTFTSTAGTAFECRLDPQPDSPWESCPSTVSFTGLAQGQHTFEVRAADRFGRFDPTPARVTFFVDIPVNGARLEAVPLTGTVRIKAPGATGFRPLTEGETIAVGSVVDTTAGKVSLTSIDATGEEQRASFFAGLFQVNQQPGRRLVTLALRGAELGRCGGNEEAAERPSAGPRRREPRPPAPRRKPPGARSGGAATAASAPKAIPARRPWKGRSG